MQTKTDVPIVAAVLSLCSILTHTLIVTAILPPLALDVLHSLIHAAAICKPQRIISQCKKLKRIRDDAKST
jgi:hypothetical protein